jgi:hypothetical protein
MKLKYFFCAIMCALLFLIFPKHSYNGGVMLQASDIDHAIILYEGLDAESSYFAESRHLLTGRAFDPGYAGFTLRYRGKEISYEHFSVFALPGEPLHFSLPDDSLIDDLIPVTRDLHYRKTAAGDWILNAPSAAGIYPVDFVRPGTGEKIRVQVIVMVPRSQVKNGWLNGYRIGSYPDKPLNGNPNYLPPRGFIEVTPENMHTKVSPHFTLGQFLCKQEGGFPKYIVLKERLLLQLEHILEESNRLGYRANTFHVMSGYRTPWYNQRIGNGRYSRHIYGDAADIFIDTSPGNGRMDDLNGDGVIDRKDAKLLFDLVDSIQRNSDETYRQGGLGLYGPRPWRGPFIHVDGRGHYARWTLD